MKSNFYFLASLGVGEGGQNSLLMHVALSCVCELIIDKSFNLRSGLSKSNTILITFMKGNMEYDATKRVIVACTYHN